MKFTAYPCLLAAAMVVALPVGRSESQLAPVADPLTELQGLQNANDDLIKRQDATLKDLTEMTEVANEVRLFSKRG